MSEARPALSPDPARTAPLLALRDVTAAYGAVEALKGVSVHVNPGEIVTLIGANGAGKSTLLMTIFGSPRARSGRIIYDGQDITGLPMHRIARAGIAQSPEGRRVFPRMTVRENLLMGAQALGVEPGPGLERAFSLFPRLKERESQRGGTLSGGEQQMLAIARALMSNPRLLLLDEPSLGLAPLVVRQIFSAIRDLNERTGLTVLLVEQNANQALRLAHRAYVLVTGRISLEGTGAELLARPEVRDAYLGGGH
ncbi:ABC transporter ATP-binding protein [Muricoccus radiodurans]|uniref:ABC transporter ATP-binding protein n=1 Tax=Muricoccus radiodurans TaxID=2231721 RepID=UPI003CF99E1D